MRKNSNSQRILVTGGAGFLGSHLCEALLRSGHHVVCLDNFSTGRRQNVERLVHTQRFSIIEHDVVAPLDLEIDQIFNLACPASPPRYQANPIHTTKTSVMGALNLLELARRRNALIFQASTSEVYGDPHVHPQVESYWGNVNPLGPRACYDEGKRCAETLFLDYHRNHGTTVKIARIFNTYGPRMQPDDGRVISNFIIQALMGRDITIYGDGSQTRSFCFVDDLIDGFLRLMASPGSFTGPVNLGNPCEFTIAELANLVIELTGSTSKIAYCPPATDDPRQRRPDIGLAMRTLDWQPRVPLITGLEKTILYFDRLLEGSGVPLAEVA